MVPNEIESTRNDDVNEGQDSPSKNIRDQVLLKALQDLIAHVVDQKGMYDIGQTPLGIEATKLIIALQDFVLSIIGHSESMTQHTVVQVNLGEGRLHIPEDNELQKKHDDDVKGTPLLTASSDQSHGDKNIDNKSQSGDLSENSPTTFHDKLLKGLREHVFNTMPIRLLSFEPHGLDLKITLLERGVIHRRLETAMCKKMHEKDHLPIMRPSNPGHRWSKMELEKDEEAIERVITKYTRYAILSHTWLRTSSEVTYSNWNNGLFDYRDPGYQKLVNFCKISWKDHGLTLGWMDTVCINKESSSELDESIRSMYNWYSRADVCITYLSETASLPTMHVDPWFSRGWTLQEMLAPRVVKFYNAGWKRLMQYSDNDKEVTMIMEQIKRATTISKEELHNIYDAPISRRMQLAATREVTREEDIAYSLMGIFNVSISTAYGEGAHRAFFRLLQEILASFEDVLDILNWAGDHPASLPHASRILPTSPLNYVKSYQFHLPLRRPMEPLTLTHLGLRVPVILMPAISIPGKASQYIPIGDYSATVNISPLRHSMRAPKAIYNLLDKRIYSPDRHNADGGYQLTLAVFNFSGDAATIFIMKSCVAKVLSCNEHVGKVTSSGLFRTIDTDAPVFFDLSQTATPVESTRFFNLSSNAVNKPAQSNYRTESDYRIERNKLAKHGMQLVSLYL